MWKSCLPISFMFSIGCMRRIKSLCVLSGFKDASQKAEFLTAAPSLHKIPLFEPWPAPEILEMLPQISAWVGLSIQSMLTSHLYFFNTDTFFVCLFLSLQSLCRHHAEVGNTHPGIVIKDFCIGETIYKPPTKRMKGWWDLQSCFACTLKMLYESTAHSKLMACLCISEEGTSWPLMAKAML